MVKISDVAKLANVSVTTVSRVLSNDNAFSTTEITRKRVFDAVNQLGYVPLRQKKTQRSIKEQRRKTIGCLMMPSREDEINDPYYLSIRIGIEKQCLEMGFSLSCIIRPNEHVTRSDFAGMDGLIIVGSTDPNEITEHYYENNNIVLVNNLLKHDPQYDYIVSDLDKAIDSCLDILLDLGHSEIGYIGGVENITKIEKNETEQVADIRYQAFRKKMLSLGLLKEDYIHIGDWTAADGYRMTREAIGKGIMPTAFIVGSDPLCMGVMHALREESIRIPEDISLISFDDIEAAAFMDPPLSSVKIFTDEIGKQAVKALADRLNGRTVNVNIIVPSKLSVRNSYSAPKGKGGE